MKKIFIDSDVILDFLLDREPFNNEIAEIIEKSIAQKVDLCVSSVTITNLNYIIGRFEDQKTAAIKTKKILRLVKVENVGQLEVNKSID